MTLVLTQAPSPLMFSTQDVKRGLPGDTGNGDSGGGDFPSTGPLPVNRTPWNGRIAGEGGPTTGGGGSGDTGDVTVIYNESGGGGSGTPINIPTVPEASSALADALAALAGLFGGGGGAAASPQPQAVAVPVSNAGKESADSGRGKSVVLVAGAVLGVGFLLYWAYSHGWFKSKAKKDGGSKDDKKD